MRQIAILGALLLTALSSPAIDPHDPALTNSLAGRVSRNGKYRIPAGNPFFFQPPSVSEIFSYGHRNPYRFSFDASLDLAKAHLTCATWLDKKFSLLAVDDPDLEPLWESFAAGP